MNEKNLVVVGLGYVGLPLAVLAKQKGWEVTGVDVDSDKVDRINNGELPLRDEDLAKDFKEYRPKATTDASVVRDASAIIIAVPTPVNEENLPDLGPVLSAITSVLPHLASGQVLIVESTVNPGVMDEMILPVLRERKDIVIDADVKPGEDAVFVLHCPERVNPGDPKWTVRNIPRVIGGYSKEGVAKGKQVYEAILDAPVLAMSSATEAEAVKILENTFRDINIAFINEMAKSFSKLGIDITNVIKGAATKPFAFMPHYPGNGVGGHCISVDPYYMIERAKQVGFDHEFLKLARNINDSMPAYTIERMQEGLAKLQMNSSEVTVAMLGVAYKKDIDDIRESPCLEIIHLLSGKVKETRVFDPFVSSKSTVATMDDAVKGADVVMLGTNHTEMTAILTPEYLKSMGVKLVVDGKNAIDGQVMANAGIPYYGIGRTYADTI